VDFKNWNDASLRWRITSRFSRTITRVQCTFRTMTNPAARPWPSRKSTFCGVLGAALIMQWNTLPTTLQREVFDTAGSAGKLLETAALRGQIARFLHKHKNDGGCNKLTPTEDTHSDARLGAVALSRWDDEGGAVRDGLPM
jgi:hypothetical protein